MLETSDIFVEIVDRSEFHSAASLNKAAAPNSCHLATNAPACTDANCRSRFASEYPNAATIGYAPLSARSPLRVVQGDPSGLTKIKRFGMNRLAPADSECSPGRQERSAAPMLTGAGRQRVNL
jgi:hypothetical protein